MSEQADLATIMNLIEGMRGQLRDLDKCMRAMRTKLDVLHDDLRLSTSVALYMRGR